ncbi:MAG: CBS domain-containing protein [Leptolinea sp.]|nr:CBS domain-containing protein [Leptolinea sp.]
MEKIYRSSTANNPIQDLSEQKPGKRMCIYIGESDRWRGKPLDMAILHTLRTQGLAGATVFRGTSGFGAHSYIRTAAIEVLSVDLPILIEAVDSPERIQRGLEAINPMIDEGLITLEDVHIVKYTHRYMNPLPADRLVAEVMTGDVKYLSENLSIRKAWEMMIHNELKALPVVDEKGVVIGILTDEDLLERAGIKQRLSVTLQLGDSTIQDELNTLSRSNKQVKDVMTHPVVTIRKDDTLGQAVSIMVKMGLKRLPVIDDSGRLAGMLSRLDVLKQIADSSTQYQSFHLPEGIVKVVKDIMRTGIPTVQSDETLVSVVEKFVKYDTHRLVVADRQGKAIGLIADSDVVARVHPAQRRGILDALRNFGKPPLGRETAEEIMSPGVTTITPASTISEAARMMLKEGRKWLVVVDEEEIPIGLVDRRVLLEALASHIQLQ